MNGQRFFNINLPQLPTNVDPKIEPDLRDVYNALRNMSYLVGQYGGFEVPEEAYQNPDGATYTAGPQKRRLYCEAGEALTYGAIVHLYQDAGTTKARFANATDNSRPGYGICNTIGTTSIGDTVEIVLPGSYVTSISGLTHGSRYFLATVDGTISTGIPGVAGNIREALGFALTADVFFFLPNLDWTTV